MKSLLFSGAAAAAILVAGTAFAQAAPAGQPASRAPMAQTEARADVPAHVQKMFARLDANKDGYISKDEVSAVEAQREQKVEQRAQRFDPDKIFARIDANHDGKITPAEAAVAHNARAQAKGGKPANATAFGGAFARADANKDGAITRAEFDTMGAQMRARMEKAGMHRGLGGKMFETADTNKDGKVSVAEAQATALAHFDRADLNHDGKLTPEERQQARQAFKGQRPS